MSTKTTSHDPQRNPNERSSDTPDEPFDGAGVLLAERIEVVSITSIRQYERDLREHPDRQITKLAASIQEVGFLAPIVIDRNGVIVIGHGRWLAAQKLELKAVPIIRADHLSAAQVKAFRLADNKIGSLSSWKEQGLAIELKELTTLDFDGSLLDITGFEIAEIDVVINSYDGSEPDAADELPEPEKGPPVSQEGDLWKLGNHRLFHGSALVQTSYLALMAGEKAKMGFADAPYNVPIKGHVSLRAKHEEFVMGAGEFSAPGFKSFLSTFIGHMRDFSVDGSLHYLCMDARHSLPLLLAAQEASLEHKTTCTWAKTNAGMGSLYRQQTEFVHVFKHGKAPHINNIMLGKWGRHRTTLWTYAGANTFRKGRDADLADHPTVKPWVLVADAIKDCTKPHDIILDPFCGSGTTIIAAEKTGRRGYGIELDGKYVDVTIRRWEALTGLQAVHLPSGLTFAEMRIRRTAQPAETATDEPTMEACHD